MIDSPVYVSPFLGAGADWLCLLDPDLVPLVSWMGGKRRLARDILTLLELRPGRPVPAVLGDASWWGWVWPTVLDPEMGPRVSTVLRSWRGEDPRALWFRLRDLGPMEDRAESAAQLLWLQARAASGVPVWWEGSGRMVAMSGRGDLQKPGCKDPELLVAPGDGRKRQRACERSRVLPAGTEAADLVSMDGHGRGPYRAWQMTGQPAGPKLIASDGRGDPREAGARTTRGERLIATTRGGQEPGAPFEAGHKGTDTRGGGGIVDPGTIADRADRIRARLVKASGGEAGFGYDDGVRRGKGWRLFEPGDIADRADRIRGAAIGEALIVHAGAADLTAEWAPRLGARGRIYLDPPYQGATGYPVGCPRDEVLAIAETWARHGARVVLSEAVGLAAELGAGWTETRLREGPKAEWVTCFGVDTRAILPPLLRRMGA